MDKTDNTAGEFKVGELVLVAEALGLAPTSAWGKRKIVDVIRIRLRKNGVPEESEDSHKGELLDDFLFVDGWVDEEGFILEGGDGLPDLEEFQKEKGIEELPDCFGAADDADPACSDSRCILYVYCAEERIKRLPPCFAVLFSKTEKECINCLEAPFCKESYKPYAS